MEEGEWENERMPSTFPLPSSSLTDAGNISGRAPMLSRPSPTRPNLTPLTWMAFIRFAFNASGREGRGSQKVLAFLRLISFRYGFLRFLALSAITNILKPRDKSREIP